MERTRNRRQLGVSLVLAALGIAAIANPGVAQVITELPVHSAGQPFRLASGPGGMWFTERGANRIGMITSEGSVFEFDIHRIAYEIVAGPDGNLWFTSDRFISRMTPAGTVTDFSISGLARGITVGPDGNIWFTEMPPGLDAVGDAIGRATMEGQITEFTDEHRASCWGDITSGPDGNLWCTDWSEIGDDSIVRVTPSGFATRFRIPDGLNSEADVGPTMIAVGSDGAMWFAERRLPRIGRLTTSGEYSSFPVDAEGISAGSDGNLWVAQDKGIGRLTIRGEYESFSLPTHGQGAIGIATGNDGRIWFTESNAFQIGRIDVSVSRTLTPIERIHKDARELPPR